jgi:hypothetical protein
MIASGLGTGYGSGWDDKPTAGAGVASSNVLAYGGNEKMGFDRSNSAREYDGGWKRKSFDKRTDPNICWYR